jgi:two-component system nitrate/nitrite response regulator NarL
MKAVILTPFQLLGDGLAQSLNRRPEISVVAVAADLTALRQTLSAVDADIILIDITQAMDLKEIRAIAAERPNLTLLALGQPEQRGDVMRRGRAAFNCYVARDRTVDELCDAMVNAVASRLNSSAVLPRAVSAESSAGLLRRCFTWMRQPV